VTPVATTPAFAAAAISATNAVVKTSCTELVEPRRSLAGATSPERGTEAVPRRRGGDPRVEVVTRPSVGGGAPRPRAGSHPSGHYADRRSSGGSGRGRRSASGGSDGNASLRPA